MSNRNTMFFISSEKSFFLLSSLLWGYVAFFRYFEIIFHRIPIIGYYIFPAILVILILMSLKYIVSKIRNIDLLLTVAVICVCFFTVFIGNEITQPFNELCIPYLTKYFPMYFIGIATYYYLSDNITNIKYYHYISVASIITLTIVYRITTSDFDYEWNSSQYIPYALLPHLVLIMAWLFDEFSILKLGVLLYGIVNMVMLGNRGSTVCLLVCFLMLFLYKTKEMSRKAKFTILLLIIIAIVIVWFTNLYEMAILAMYQLALKNHMSTRVFQTFLGEYSAGVSFDSGRLDIQLLLFEKLNINPMGLGLGSDRYYTGFYAHNLFLEILLDFGYIFGSLIIIFIIIWIVKGFKQINNNKIIGELFLIMFSIGFVKLFISGSYLSEFYFYILLGLAVAMNRNRYNANYN